MEKILKKDKHLKQNIGEEIQISLYSPIEKCKIFKGLLKDFNDKEIILETNNIDKIFERKNISQIKTIYNWDK